MVADNLHDFLVASVGASASFIGLLFVALTLVLGRLRAGSLLAGRERALASSSYTALFTVFFISMFGLVPGVNMGWAMVGLGWLGMLSSLRLARAPRANAAQKENAPVVSALTLLYVALAIFGIYTATGHSRHIQSNVLFAILFVFYTAALSRAWALIGVEPMEHAEPKPKS
ncbi:MAG TPA: hypothetical protein VLF59_01695 [Candidatus Saccharimonadales bacterium]|nr:hypothetical protein [Candidatus Saccharimonadales bacterium]